MMVTGLRKPKNDEINEDDALNVISAVVKEPGIDENDSRKHFDNIHPIGGAKKQKPSKNYKIHYS